MSNNDDSSNEEIERPNNRISTRDNKLSSLYNSSQQRESDSRFEEDGEFIYKRNASPDQRKRRKINTNTPITQILEDHIVSSTESKLNKLKSPFGESDQYISPYNLQYQVSNRNDESSFDRVKQLMIRIMKKQIETEMFQDQDQTVVNSAKIIKEESIKDLIDRRIHINKQSDLIVDPIIVPNPHNVSNCENIQIYSKRIKQLKLQSHEWKETFKNSIQPVENMKINYEENEKNDDLINEIKNDLEIVKSNLNISLNIDKLYHKSYQLLKSTDVMKSIKDDTIKIQLEKLITNYINTKDKIDPIELIKAICELES
ncbi:unnamed protein product [Candida verbasci]|uniref:Kinetochore protein n=1 Tax=Candida verbasci TaxID=1227364 RepID=A0A9W4TW31_9ASCO|nr:unnamed protein product [Candida verbasci]